MLIGGKKAPALTDYGTLLEPSEAQEPILARGVKAVLLEWLTELWAEKELKALMADAAPKRKPKLEAPLWPEDAAEAAA